MLEGQSWDGRTKFSLRTDPGGLILVCTKWEEEEEEEEEKKKKKKKKKNFGSPCRSVGK
jgi:hypothetical protein